MRIGLRISAGFYLAACLGLAPTARGQVTEVWEGGKRIFVNTGTSLRRGALLPGTSSGQSPAPGYAPAALPASTASGALPGEPSRVSLKGMADQAAVNQQIDPALVSAMIEAESAWNPRAVSSKGAMGLMQLMPGTAQEMGVTDPFDPRQNLDGGVRYLRLMLEKYGGDLDLALAAYNAGGGAVDRAGGVPKFRETRNYVQKVTDAYFNSGSGRPASFVPRLKTIYVRLDRSGKLIYTNE